MISDIKPPKVFACVFVYDIFIELDTKRGNDQWSNIDFGRKSLFYLQSQETHNKSIYHTNK
jgi:hypothetical protein